VQPAGCERAAGRHQVGTLAAAARVGLRAARVEGAALGGKASRARPRARAAAGAARHLLVQPRRAHRGPRPKGRLAAATGNALEFLLESSTTLETVRDLANETLLETATRGGTRLTATVPVLLRAWQEPESQYRSFLRAQEEQGLIGRSRRPHEG